jgi:hypothetical protein
VRGLARRVRLARRVTWLPLLALALVTFGAIPAQRYTNEILSDCRIVGDGARACKVWMPGLQGYWLAGLAVAYLVVALGYARVARARGLGARVVPYVITGFALVVILTVGMTLLSRTDVLGFPDRPGGLALVALRLIDYTGAVGLALLVLAWLERHVALLLFTLGYLVVVLVPVNFGWGAHWGTETWFIPQLLIDGGVLLVGSAGFALAQRPR